MPNGARTQAAAAVDPSPPTWTAAAVARRLGVAAATLRSWSARYGVGPASHTAGRYRRYSSGDIAELETMLRLHHGGMPMATAAVHARGHHRPTAAADASGGQVRDDGLGQDLAALISAARDLDSDGGVRILERSLARRGVVASWNLLCRPALTDPSLQFGTTVPATVDPPAVTPAGGGIPGDGPEPDPMTCVDAECVLVWAIITSLRRLPRPPPPPPDADRVLLACAVDELHTLGLDVLLAALDERHLPARTLGPSVPTSALLHAARHSRPAAVFVWAQTPATADPGVLAGLHPVTRGVVAVGPGWAGRTLPAGTRTADDLETAVSRAELAVRSRGGE